MKYLDASVEFRVLLVMININLMITLFLLCSF